LLAQSVNIIVYGPVNILVYRQGSINIMFSSGFCPNSFFVLNIYNNKKMSSDDSFASLDESQLQKITEAKDSDNTKNAT